MKPTIERFRFGPKSLRNLVYSFWERWRKTPGYREWRIMSYVIKGKKFKMDLAYPDEVNTDEDISERRPIVVKKYFGDIKVDYTKPHG
jgi:hypothetical protein